MQVDISVIVPTYGRKERLRACLNSLFNQTYPKEKLEIIVVDDKADEIVAKMLKDLKQYHSQLRYVVQYHKGPAAARNLGMKVSVGHIVAFIDDDCIADRDWATSMVEIHKSNPDIVAIGGDTFVSTDKTSVLVGQFLSTCSIESYVEGKKGIIFFPTCNVSFKRWILQRYKFDENFLLPGGEDLEFFWRLFKDGYKFAWNKNAKIIHNRDSNFQSFIKQAYIYGRGNFLVQSLHRDHPLLKELETGGFSFWIATLLNTIKIPRFSYLLGKRCIKENNIQKLGKKISVYVYFTLHKIFYIVGNIVEFFRIRKDGLYPRPLHIPGLLILDTTHHCNLMCQMCDIWKTAEREKDLDIYYIKKILSQAKSLGIKEIALSGGEPLVRGDIFEIFDYARKINIKNLGVLTNGLLVEKYIDNLKPYLIDNTISLVISLDSLTPDIHNYMRNSDTAWQGGVRSLEAISLMKKEHPQINFNVITIIFNQNLEELPGLAKFIKSLGANSLQFQVLLPNNLRMAQRKSSPFWIPKDRLSLLDEAIGKLIEFKKENAEFVRNSINNLLLVKKYYRGTISGDEVNCFSAESTILVSNRGECTTCFSCYGDIRRQDLRSIIFSKERTKAKDMVKNCPWPCLLPCFCDMQYGD
jgi:MoaA/NifB/PqqE/SkfB family radical SAM enzyme/GT2 family glycosyltransferase